MTVAKTPIVVPARLRTIGRGEASCDKVTLSSGSCSILMLLDVDPNRVKRSVRTLRQARTISSLFLSSPLDGDELGDVLELV